MIIITNRQLTILNMVKILERLNMIKKQKFEKFLELKKRNIQKFPKYPNSLTLALKKI